MTSLDRLLERFGPPASPTPYEARLQRGEERLELPSDYQRLLEAFGPGRFLDHVTVRAPGASVPLFPDMVAATEADADYEDDGIPAWPQPGCLVSWGDENGDPLYWRTDGDDPDAWPVLWRDHEDGTLEPMSGTATDVLAQLLLDDPEPEDDIDPGDEERWFTPLGDIV